MISPQEALANLDYLYECMEHDEGSLASYYKIQDYLRQQIELSAP